MHYNTEEIFQKHHQGMIVWHLAEEISSPSQANQTAMKKTTK